MLGRLGERSGSVRNNSEIREKSLSQNMSGIGGLRDEGSAAGGETGAEVVLI
jgi:hypothetical protein